MEITDKSFIYTFDATTSSVTARSKASNSSQMDFDTVAKAEGFGSVNNVDGSITYYVPLSSAAVQFKAGILESIARFNDCFSVTIRRQEEEEDEERTESKPWNMTFFKAAVIVALVAILVIMFLAVPQTKIANPKV
ncbi:MAG: hypothetical protein EBU84_15940 [Actinobacteria bacterium]|nr:hypothetical protein [Actinomycetota bacterium]